MFSYALRLWRYLLEQMPVVFTTARVSSMKRAKDQTLGETQRGMRPRDHRVAGSMRRQRVVVRCSAKHPY
jgi:hypothetical protein